MQAVRPMLSNIAKQSGVSLCTFAVGSGAVLRRNYKAGHLPGKRPTMNDMPVPQGDFFEQHALKNKRYNTILGAGILFFAVTLSVASNSGLIDFNWAPPKSYD